MYQKIKDIHDSDMFGIFVETGNGLAVTSQLLKVSGSSKTVYMAECPYSKDYQSFKYGTMKGRAVSMEAVRHILNYYTVSTESMSEKINTIMVASFQIGEENDIATHGWFALRYAGINEYFHVSVHESRSREDYIEIISEIGVNILHNRISGNMTVPAYSCIDIAVRQDLTQVPIENMIESLAGDYPNFLCFDSTGTQCRLEDLFRDKEHILLYKGTFNPVHAGHIYNAEVAKEFGQPTFVLSSNVFQKGSIESADLAKRVRMINSLGYPVIVNNVGLFDECTEFLRQKFKQSIVYIVGSDTMNRLLSSSYKVLSSVSFDEAERFKANNAGVTFFVINRPGSELTPGSELVKDFIVAQDEHEEHYHVSSTKIREMEKNGDLEGMVKLMGQEVFNNYMKIKNESKKEN